MGYSEDERIRRKNTHINSRVLDIVAILSKLAVIKSYKPYIIEPHGIIGVRMELNGR